MELNIQSVYNIQELGVFN